MDSIQLTGIRAEGTHGVLEDEHSTAQPFVVDVVMQVDTRLAATTDNIIDTVDYGQIANRIVHIIEGEHVDLIETLAQRIANAILQSHAVQQVTVTVHKPQAPITVPFDDVSVTITRAQEIESGLLSGQTEPSIASRVSSLAHEQQNATLQSTQRSLSEHTTRMSHADHDMHTLHAEHTERAEYDNDGNAEPSMHHAVIALGGNIGNVEQTLRSAIVSIDSIPGNQISGISPLYRTQPWGMPDGTPEFYNAVVQLDTMLDARTLLHTLQTIEATFGRRRDKHWSNRTLDLDIIDFDHTTSSDPMLSLPHPRAWQRAFVLAPWLALDPDAQLVGAHSGAVAELLPNTPDAHAVTLVSQSWILGDSAHID